MYPLKFNKIFKEKIWGGRSFEKYLDMTLPNDNNFGESWEVSIVKDNVSKILNGKYKGKTIEEIIAENPEKILGKEVAKRFNSKFPLLIKYLDVNDKLSVQVHPSDEYALKVENSYGKTESWYVMEASDDAELILGLKDGITKEIFKEKVENKDFTNLFQTVNVKKGDFINLEAGTVHATLNGSILICEIQQNSDTTYRIYDFDRMVDGSLRPLHLSKALDVINFNEKVKISTEKDRKKIKLENLEKEELIRGRYFYIDKLNISGEIKDEINSSFKIYSILEGNGQIKDEDGNIVDIKKGETIFIAANENITINGQLEILKSFLG